MNYKLVFLVVLLHIVFIVSGYFVLHYSVFLLLSQTLTVTIIGYVFLLFFLCICVLIHYLVVDIYDMKTSQKKKWIFSVSGMLFSSFVSFLFLVFLI